MGIIVKRKSIIYWLSSGLLLLALGLMVACTSSDDDTQSKPSSGPTSISIDELVSEDLGCTDTPTSKTDLSPTSDLSECPPADQWQDQQGPPTLSIELGDVVTGVYRSWDDDALVPIIHGPQGGIHIEISPRVRDLQGVAQDQAHMLFKGIVNAGCMLASLDSVAPIELQRVSETLWQHSGVAQGKSAVMIIFPVSSSKSHLYCGQWLEVHIMMRHKDSGAWGAVHRRVRLYDTKPIE